MSMSAQHHVLCLTGTETSRAHCHAAESPHLLSYSGTEKRAAHRHTEAVGGVATAVVGCGKEKGVG